MPVLAAMRKRKAHRVREAVGRSMHDFGNHRQRAHRPRTDTWNEQQFGEVDRRPIRCGSQIGVKARRQHVACPDTAKGPPSTTFGGVSSTLARKTFAMAAKRL